MPRIMSSKFADRIDPLMVSIKQKMKDNAFSYKELAEASGVSAGTMMYNFNGTHNPIVDNVRRLATALGYKLQLVPMTEHEMELASIGKLEYSPILEAKE